MPSPASVALHTSAASETESLGVRLAALLARGDVLYLVGDLGAGKTCFVRGLVAGLDSADQVTSPTFVLLNQYRGREPLYHVDLYRTGGEGIDELGLWDHAEHGILAIEWPDLAPGQLPPPALTLKFDHGAPPDSRDIRIEAHGSRGALILDSLGRE